MVTAHWLLLLLFLSRASLHGSVVATDTNETATTTNPVLRTHNKMKKIKNNNHNNDKGFVETPETTTSTTATNAKRGNSIYTEAALQDRITELPGLDYDTGFHQFSGYLTVDKEKDRSIFYWFVESQNDPETDPVILWTNGGPGCSGLIGFGTEHGPFVLTRHGSLYPNQYSWNAVASIIYIEQPAGVGFSYSQDDTDYTTVGDTKAAEDMWAAILDFFEKFSPRRLNPFFIASESYGGHYIPHLTQTILDRNTDGLVNFQGFLLGNPYVDPFSNTVTEVEAYYSHGLLPKPLFDRWVASCTDRNARDDEECDDIEYDMFESVGKAGINPYAMDFPVCAETDGTTDSASRYMSEQRRALSWKAQASRTGQAQRLVQKVAHPKSPLQSLLQSPSSSSLFSDQEMVETGPPYLPTQDRYRPCADLHLETYLNRPDVRKALHVSNQVADRKWSECSDIVEYSEEDVDTPQLSLYQDLIHRAQTEVNLRMLVFSGDDDAICSTASTQFWIYDLGIEPKKDMLWKPWKVGKQVAGFVTHFDMGATTGSSFTFATVHGAGHEVPSFRPREALHLLETFLNGGEL